MHHSQHYQDISLSKALHQRCDLIVHQPKSSAHDYEAELFLSHER
ncbi:MAG: hypothetical protein RI935_107 [Candidatus Parcubacteria bacterium]|jgi:hypothetical protein